MATPLPEPAPRVRIGELSDRVGESPTLLRAWERRYGLLSPVRSAGGFRLYGAEDERRVRAMQALLAAGVSARQAAEAVLSTPAGDVPAARASASSPAGDGIEDRRSRLTETLGRFDDVGANAVLDRLLADLGVTTVISEVIVPYLVDLGERWADGSATIAEEHFATSLIRGRLLGLARGWDGGSGPRALLACPSGELHDLGLICFGIALRGHGWRITYLGADTPQSTLIEAAAQLTPNLIVLAATKSSRLRALAGEAATATLPIAIAGRGATRRLADELGATLLDVDPVTAAARVAAETPVTPPRELADWHVARWGALGWIETGVKSLAFLCAYVALASSITTGWSTPRGVRIVELVLIGIATVGLLGGDRRPPAGTRNRRDGVRRLQQRRPPGAACEPGHDGRPGPSADRVRGADDVRRARQDPVPVLHRIHGSKHARRRS